MTQQTAKEKAKDIFDRMMYHITYNCQPTLSEMVAKECALIAVDEIILSAPFEPADTDWDEAGSSAQYWYPQKLEDSGKWWGAVKQEIEAL